MALPLVAFSYLPRNRNKCVKIYNLPSAPIPPVLDVWNCKWDGDCGQEQE